MSTDWGIGCRTCRDAGREHFTGEWDNCRNPESLQRLIDARDVVLAAADALGDLVVFRWEAWDSADLGHRLASFFREHAGHALAPMNEHRRFSDQCWKQAKCGACSAEHWCVLMADHDGECSWVTGTVAATG